ncbi:hypothetical protein M409DRAFT_23517 [Zasmidium cellare ATCC 36951]|uniref:DUF1275 domain protein n=1 Tax=Zasmidium cellare ATCC 36951 TaxID=1080233 RepID=A0A6A6CLM0_ZASCE|nr:uncharacterized protein M409DRAFT_23517 [Zasmidium cellare ATCC 36951]KAF2166326.1 hypothetical protein M409DRAFT_23517 [Zasmidium cellare ATCC 36951]
MANDDNANGGVNETSPLLERTTTNSNKPTTATPSLPSRLHAHFTTNVSTQWGDLALLFCYIITGVLDSSATIAWGSFVSMQTGNTIYLGTGLVAPSEGTRWLRALIAIGFFCLGSFAFARYHRLFGGRRRWVIVSSYTLQLLMVVGAALMITLGPPADPKGEVDVWVAVPLGLVAFQSGGQAVISRVLKYGALTSVVLTSIYCDLFSDQELFAGLREHAERNRRLAAPVLVLLGAVIGGIWAHTSVGLMGAMWTAAGLKLVVIVAWCLWKADKDDASTV